MATREVVVLVCDVCSSEGESVATHEVAIDGKAVEAEACARCWTKAEKGLVQLFEAGRRKRRRKAA